MDYALQGQVFGQTLQQFPPRGPVVRGYRRMSYQSRIRVLRFAAIPSRHHHRLIFGSKGGRQRCRDSVVIFQHYP